MIKWVFCAVTALVCLDVSAETPETAGGPVIERPAKKAHEDMLKQWRKVQSTPEYLDTEARYADWQSDILFDLVETVPNPSTRALISTWRFSRGLDCHAMSP